jgi:two-component system KDP operon response regulator KdpE
VGKVCTHKMILVAVWGSSYGREVQYLHAYVHRLRQKLHDPTGTLIATAPGIGYRLVDSGPPPAGDASAPPDPQDAS